MWLLSACLSVVGDAPAVRPLGINFASNLTKIDAKVNFPEGAKPPINNYAKLQAYMDPNSFSPDRVPVYCYDKVALGLDAAHVAGPDICFLISHDVGQSQMVVYYPVMAQVANNAKKRDKLGNMKMDPCLCPDRKYDAYCKFFAHCSLLFPTLLVF